MDLETAMCVARGKVRDTGNPQVIYVPAVLTPDIDSNDFEVAEAASEDTTSGHYYVLGVASAE
jgi:hypothetical protein